MLFACLSTTSAVLIHRPPLSLAILSPNSIVSINYSRLARPFVLHPLPFIETHRTLIKTDIPLHCHFTLAIESQVFIYIFALPTNLSSRHRCELVRALSSLNPRLTSTAILPHISLAIHHTFGRFFLSYELTKRRIKLSEGKLNFTVRCTGTKLANVCAHG